MRVSAILTVATLMLGSVITAARAEPGGCVKYGAVGAVGGHVAGHHAVLGAAAGCAAGMYKRHEYRKHLKEQKSSQQGSN